MILASGLLLPLPPSPLSSVAMSARSSLTLTHLVEVRHAPAFLGFRVWLFVSVNLVTYPTYLPRLQGQMAADGENQYFGK